MFPAGRPSGYSELSVPSTTMRLLQLGLVMVFKANCKCGTGPVDDSYSVWRELLIDRVRTGSTQFQLHLPTAPRTEPLSLRQATRTQ